MSRKIAKIPIALRRQVRPWRETHRREILGALKKAQGDKVVAAALLGIGKTTMHRHATGRK